MPEPKRSGSVVFAITRNQWSVMRHLAAGQAPGPSVQQKRTLASLLEKGLIESEVCPAGQVGQVLSDLGWRLFGVLGAILDPDGIPVSLRPGSPVAGRLVKPGASS